MKSILWTPLAEADLTEIDDYWLSVDPDIADRIAERIRSAAEFLRSVPQGGSLIEDSDARRWRAGNSPYVLIYRPHEDTVEILRVYHDRRDRRAL
jgi:plasmid stabilization system protein ParE